MTKDNKMDPAPTITAPKVHKEIFQFPELNLSSLSKEQQTLIYNILAALWNKNCFEVKFEEATWERQQELPDQTRFLLEILGIVQKKMPLSVSNIHIRNDIQLQVEIKHLDEKIDAIIALIQQWNVNIEKDLVVLETTLPHHAEYKEKLSSYGQDHASLIQGEYRTSTNAVGELLKLIKTRLTAFKEPKLKSFELSRIVSIYDIKLEYLETNFQNYRDRTQNIQNNSKNLELKLAAMKVERDKFEYAFCLLHYTISNSMMCARNSIAFNTGFRSGYYSMPGYAPRNIVILNDDEPIAKNTSIPNISKLSNNQKNYTLKIFYQLFTKTNFLNGTEEKVFKISKCKDPFFKTLLMTTCTWVPLLNDAKNIQNQILILDVTGLITLVEKTTTKFQMWDEKYKLQLAALQLPLASIQLEDVRTLDMNNYAKVSGEELNTISTQRKQLEDKINQRLSLDSKEKLSSTFLKFICNSHDIEMNTLIANISAYQAQTLSFQQLLKTLTEKITTMNTTISDFRHSFDYFSYLFENKLENTNGNQIWFDWWYACGCYISIQKGNFKTPPSGAKLPVSLSLDLAADEDNNS